MTAEFMSVFGAIRGFATDWSAIIALAALWISYRSYRAATAEKMPSLRIGVLRAAENDGKHYYTFEVEYLNHSEKPLIPTAIVIKRTGTVKFADEYAYDGYGGMTGPASFEKEQPALADSVRPQGTPHSGHSHGDRHFLTINFQCSKPRPRRAKIVVKFKFGSEEEREHKRVFNRSVSNQITPLLPN